MAAAKRHFALQLLKYLTQFVDKCAYDTLEQGLSKSFQNAWNDADMQSVGTKVVVYSKEGIKQLRERRASAKVPTSS